MRLLLLGTGGYHPNERRHTACYLLPDLGLQIDAGTGTFRIEKHLRTTQLDIVLTHAHLDHVAGLTYLFGLECEGKPVQVTVHGPKRSLEAVRTALFDRAIFPVEMGYRYQELSSRFEHPSGALLRSFSQNHPGGSLGLRVDYQGKSFGYVTDTVGLTEPDLALLQGVDLLLHEGYFTEAERDFARLTGHATAGDAARAAAACDAGQLLLIHRNPRDANDTAALDEASAIFKQVACAEDESEIHVGA